MLNRNEEKKEYIRKMLKKGASVSLCALLAGGLAVGSYQGVNYLSAAKVQAAAADDAYVALMKSEKTDDAEEDSKEDSKEEKSTTAKGNMDVSDIVEKTMSSVVAITTVSIEEVQNYYGIFGQYGGYAPETEQEVEGSGSGIIIGKNDDELLIVTNYHVVEGAKTVSVGFVDNQAYEAKVKGYDSDKDLAVVAVSLKDISDDTMDAITIAKIGDSDALKVGEQVVAIGNALGYGQSVTTGIVSAKNRRADSDYNPQESTDDDENYDGMNLIQTDAAINPGNSGGALLNMDGEVVGINSAKLAATTVEGIGYSIAISDVADTIEDLMNQETREKIKDGKHGVLGVSVRDVSEEAAQMYGMPEGVYVVEVNEDGGAADAGIIANSIITKIDGKRVRSTSDLLDLLEYYAPGEEVEITVQVASRNGYEEETTTVKLGENKNADEDEDEDEKDSEEKEEENTDGKYSSLFRDWDEEKPDED